MSGVHKNPTISFRISDYERREIEARIKASGMMKKTFFTRSCIYGRICVVGKKETVYMLVQTLENMQADIQKIYDLTSTLTENINEEENEIIYENDNIGIIFKIDEQNILSINIKDNNDNYLLEFDNIK